MTDFATLAATQRRAYRTREAMLRQQHAQASMSGKSRILPVHAWRSERPCLPNRHFMISAAKISREPIPTDAATCIKV
jgi:hypothetical protein